jgi:hypothetical protein
MSSTPFGVDEPDAWQLTIGQRAIPQETLVMSLRGLKTGKKLDIKEATGADGASITKQGRKLARFNIVLTTANREGFAEMMRILDLCDNSDDAIPVSHPMLTRAKVSAMIVEDIDWPDSDDVSKPVATLSCVQFAPKRKSAKSVTKAVTSTLPASSAVFNATPVVPKPTKPTMPWEKKPKP